MRLFIFIISFLILTFSNSWSLFHKKEIKYLCEDNGKKELYIFDLKNKKVFHDDKDNRGFDLKIGENYFSWELDGDPNNVRLKSGQYVMVDIIILYLNTDTNQLNVDVKTLYQGTKYSEIVYDCNELT